jgi:hypothetical protein
MKFGHWVYSATFVLVLVSLGTESTLLRGSRRERTKDFLNAAQVRTTETEGDALLASTPPLGWNSWDGYGTTVNEKQVELNAKWISQNLKQFGWEYVVVDMEWFVTNPIPEGNSKTFEYAIDAYGRYIPAPNRFPSSTGGNGFKPLGDYIHSLGLRFGIHILRGIPRQAAERNLPIAGTKYSASEAADNSDTCPWNFDNYGLNSNNSGQAYYDSIAQLYASWGVDLIKIDCISSHPYRGEEIRMVSEALKKTGRPIVLSLSPGAAPIEKLEEMRKYAQMWRISDDIWDIWHSEVPYPQGLGDQFSNTILWAGLGQPGRWPDADMLPLGYLGPSPGWGAPRQTRLTRDEQRTLITLWCIFPSPLMIGGDLTKADPWTVSLLTNPEVLSVDQHSRGNHPAVVTETIVIWTAKSSERKTDFIAVFNRGESLAPLHFSWKDLGLSGVKHVVRDLWTRTDSEAQSGLNINLAAHASALFEIREAFDGSK